MGEVIESVNGIGPAELARFAAAEARVYPMIITDPEGYERVASLIGLVATRLRTSCPDIAAVLRERDALIAALPELASAAGLAGPGPLAGEIVDSAAALRWRELQAAGAAARWEQRVAAAQASGAQWIVDEPDPAHVMAGSYRRIEWHCRSQTTVITSIDAGTGADALTYSIEVVPGGSATDWSAARSVFTDRDSWLAAAEGIRADLCAIP